VDGKSVKNVGKSTYGERIGFSATSDADLGRLCVTFMKNGNSVHFVIFHFLNRIAAQCAWYEMQNVLADVAWSVCLSVCVRQVARSQHLTGPSGFWYKVRLTNFTHNQTGNSPLCYLVFISMPLK